jgi:hypothetical protein
MRVLIDECVPRPIQKLLPGHSCTTIQTRGRTGAKRGELLLLAEPEFDVFITSDQNVRYQQNLTNRKIAILQLSTNKLRRIKAAATQLRASVAAIKPGEYLQLEIPEGSGA